MSEERFKKLEDQFTQMGNKLLSLEELLKKNNGDPDTRAKIDALVAEMDKMRKRLEAAGGNPPPPPPPPPPPDDKTKVKKEKTFEEDAGLE